MNVNVNFRTACTGFAAMLALMVLTMPARSAGSTAPIFPTGSRIGLVPPSGMTRKGNLPGFVDPAANAGIIISVFPAGAFEAMEKTLTTDALKARGVTVEKRETMQLGIGKGDLVIGTQIGPNKTPYRKWLLLVPSGDFTVAVTAQAPESAKAYSDAVIRAALGTVTARAHVPKSEYLSLLPFKVGDLSGFQISNVMPERALLLIDAPPYPHMVATDGLPAYEFDARTIIAAVPGGPSSAARRSDFARLAFGSIGGIKNVQLTMSEPVRINDREGFETVAHAKDADNGSDLMVVQWLLFGNGRTLQIVGISRASIWGRELSRLRTIRDSVSFR
ncbi:MAG: hypothetical protein ACRECV_09715 [Xanthobacteraceae bacterium]